MPATTTRVLYSGVLFSLALSVAACVPPWYPIGEGECSSAEGCGETDTTGDAGDPPLTTTSTVTGISSATSGDDGASAGTGEEITTGDAGAPPKIGDHELNPSTIQFAGAITARMWIDGGPGLADGVRMNLADGSEVELTLNLETQAFEGEILALSGFQNSDYVAVFTPWRGDGDLTVEGEALEVPYTIALHDPGDEDLFDIDKDVGSGSTTAIAALPNGEVVELLTLAPSACILRRRSAGGEILGELAPLLPDHCKAIDLEVHDGALFALMEAETLKGGQWWVAKIPHWGAPHVVIATGKLEEVAYDLAVSSEGTIAVCGSVPTIQPDDLTDAAVHIVRSDFSKFARAFDHVVGDKNHTIDERARGCEFDQSDTARLIIVGEAYGKIEKNNSKINRRFDVLYDVETDGGDLRVADAGLEVHSFATAVAFAGDKALVLGDVCADDACTQVEGKMWALDTEGDLTSTRSLGLYSNKALGPSKIRLSPAGYLVLTSGGLAGSEEAFVVRAYDPFKAEPLWTYSRQDAGLVHLAHALAIGPYGQVYVGGFGAGGYPLFVILYG